LKAGVWFRRGRLLIISPVQKPPWLLSGRDPTYPVAQILQATSQEALAGQVDVLLALTGAHATIALEDLDHAIAAIDPRIVIPMHYWHPRGVLEIEPVERFLQRHPEHMLRRCSGPSLTIQPDHLPTTRQIIVLDQAR
jgi:hypothetical protein